MLLKVYKDTECYISKKKNNQTIPISESFAKTKFIQETIIKIDEDIPKQKNLIPVITTVGDIESLVGDMLVKTIVWVNEEDLIRL